MFCGFKVYGFANKTIPVEERGQCRKWVILHEPFFAGLKHSRRS